MNLNFLDIPDIPETSSFASSYDLPVYRLRVDCNVRIFPWPILVVSIDPKQRQAIVLELESLTIPFTAIDCVPLYCWGRHLLDAGSAVQRVSLDATTS